MSSLRVAPHAAPANDGQDLAIGLAVIAAGAVLYVLPTIVAIARKSAHLTRIVLVNLLLGWTIHGWIAALGMALRSSRTTPKTTGVVAKSQPAKRPKSSNPFAVERDCPRCGARIPMMAPVCPACGFDLYAQVPSR